jgi:predicted hotdog family 3-hydroxylacyl-ACP dehydratase
MIETFTTDELLPQRPPFVMIDRLRDVTDTTTETELTVREDNLFYQGGVLREAGIIENIAQTCAARLGYVSLVNHRPVAVGFIGAMRDLRIVRLPEKGEMLLTQISILGEVMGMTLVEATVRCGGDVIAEGQMKIAIDKAN